MALMGKIKRHKDDRVPSGFGVRLKAIRRAAGLSQTALAKSVGYSLQAVFRLEKGRTEPAWPLVLLLASVLGVTPDAFLPAKEPKR